MRHNINYDLAKDMEEKLNQSLDAVAQNIRANRRVKVMRPLAKQIIIADREDEDEDEDEKEDTVNP